MQPGAVQTANVSRITLCRDIEELIVHVSGAAISDDHAQYTQSMEDVYFSDEYYIGDLQKGTVKPRYDDVGNYTASKTPGYWFTRTPPPHDPAPLLEFKPNEVLQELSGLWRHDFDRCRAISTIVHATVPTLILINTAKS
jgi:hypothetical protein